MFKINLVVFVYIFVAQALGHPLSQKSISIQANVRQEDNDNIHRMSRSMRTQPSIVAQESLVNNLFAKIRTRRSSEEECEKLSLCKLHANSQHSFIDTFELYFVNKENAQLWDHRTHTVADCERMFASCNEQGESKHRHPAPPASAAAAPRAQRRDFRTDYSDEDYY